MKTGRKLKEEKVQYVKNTDAVSTTSHASWLTALPFIAVCVSGGFLSSFVGGAFKKHPWIDDSPKPAIWPPQWIFPVIWITNYTLMGLAVWKIWQRRDETSTGTALGLFVVHLLHNFSFIPIVYRVKKKSFYVLMDTIGLVLGIVTTRSFARVSRPAVYLMLPYVGWLSFTTFIKFLWWRGFVTTNTVIEDQDQL